MAKPIPEGYHAITPSFTFKDSRKAIEFYKKAFGAQALEVLPSPDGRRTMHATIKIGDSVLMMGDEMPASPAGGPDPNCGKSAETLGASPISLYVYVPDVDKNFRQAIAAGATETMPVADMFWGDRAGSLKDPFGYSWMIATHTRDLSDEEIKKGAEAFFAQMAKK